MRVLLWSNQPYGATFANGFGLTPRAVPSGSGHYLHDLLAEGLAELGHDVFYCAEGGIAAPLPPGIQIVTEPPDKVDILHNYSSSRTHPDLMAHVRSRGIPWVATCHLDIQGRGLDRSHAGRNWIFVSRTLARLYRSERYVHNGLNPRHYLYREDKEDYFVFMANMDWAGEKGLAIALDLAAEMGCRLRVAGTSRHAETVEHVAALCRRAGAEYLGDVRGPEKARLLAGARALLHPTQLEEAFGLAVAEALLSGTPVICSDRGACPEVITPEVGFVCRNPVAYRRAMERITDLDPAACRLKALEEYHYLKMAAGFVRQYEEEIAHPSGQALDNLEYLPRRAGARGL